MRLPSSPILHSTKIVGLSMWQSATSAASQDRAGSGLDKPNSKTGNIAKPGKQRVESKNGIGQVRKQM